MLIQTVHNYLWILDIFKKVFFFKYQQKLIDFYAEAYWGFLQEYFIIHRTNSLTINGGIPKVSKFIFL